MRCKRLPPNEVKIKIGKGHPVTLIETGAQLHVKKSTAHTYGCPIIRIDKDHYKLRRNGEIKEFQHSEKRTDNAGSILQSMKRLRDIINTNLTDVKKVTWLTLTYKENMQDEKQLYHDFRKFIMRFKYYCRKHELPNFEYISTVEYQARGALHCHVLLIWDKFAPFIANDIMYDIWKHGYTKTTSLHGNINNIGTYLTAYLTDLPLEEAIQSKADFSKHKVKTVEGKKYVKASRLHLYPPGCNLYRCSKGIRMPKVSRLPYHDVEKILDDSNAKLVFENTLYLYDDSKVFGYSFLLKNEYYDISADAQLQTQLYKASCINKKYRTELTELIYISMQYTEYSEYLSEEDKWLYFYH